MANKIEYDTPSGYPPKSLIKAISGATITSKAVTSGVNEAIAIFGAINK